MTHTDLVSIHGGHSGQFCSHARDTLEQVVQAYIAKGYTWVGITEHMPPVADRFMYTEEREAGFNTASLLDRFDMYMKEGRRLQKKYAGQLALFVGFETESYTGAIQYARELINEHQPDYILGGIHHVADIPFDSGVNDYHLATKVCGDIETLYCRYFDLQYDVIQNLAPKVMAHFDLVRIFDDDYMQRWQVPAISRRIERNLRRMMELDLILDYNVAALRKGASEPYISRPILEMALDIGVAVVPGDDSHGTAMVGAFMDEGIAVLKQVGFNTQWRCPVKLKP